MSFRGFSTITLCCWACALLAVPMKLSAEGSARGGTLETITVGPGSDCEYSDLQNAINAAGDNTELRLENVTFTGNFDIFGKDLVIRGGYDTCSDASASFSSTLDAAGSGRPLEIGSSTNPSEVSLYDLNLEGGNTGANENGGGLLIVSDNAEHDVTLVDVTISGNTSASSGGGIAIRGLGATRLELSGDTLVQNNDAVKGGGINCFGLGDGPLISFVEGGIHSNQATSQGGGVALENCRLYQNAGGFFQGVFSNSAGSVGGGVAVMGSSLFVMQGDPASPALVTSNSTLSDGGGIWAGDSATVEVIDGSISANSADSAGAGVYLDGNASFQMRPSSASACQSGECSLLRDNSAVAGGAIAVTGSGANATVLQSRIDGNTNQSTSSGAVAIVTDGSLLLEGSFIYENGGTELFRVNTAGVLRIAWSTIADNQPVSGAPELIRLLADDTTTPEVVLDSTIIRDDGRDVVLVTTGAGESYSTRFDCLVSHELTSLEGETRSFVADPQFVDAAADDYHVQATSPVIDACDDTHAPQVADIDGDSRGWDYGMASARDFDIGADEVFTGIFADRFEQ